ncbi:MFS transporter [Devosia sediminis]|uniref:MFS transporter n=1 Tax=Devosia sediminis TaxID=2798801 RepID=A0A934MQ06_9HYPH|nr:MFS transporter [Devosia sediminis]MBJ3783874.1 MFS transporter [Devosia sediminis]
MSRALTLSQPTPTTRATLFYLTFYMAPGASVMFLPIWLSEKGITPEQIGIINAVPIFVILLFNLFIGRIADRASDWRQVIVIGALIAGIVPIGLFFVSEFWGVLLLWTLTVLPIGAITPVLDAAVMRLATRTGGDYGFIRAFGTVGYMVFNGLTGFLVVWYGPAVFVPLFVGLALLRALVSLQLPAFRAPAEEPTVAAVTGKVTASSLREIAKPWFILPLFGFCMIFGTHLVLNAFGSLLWKEQGISEAVIGPLIAIGAFSEAFVMFVWRRFGGRVTARNLILVSALASVLRWLAMGFAPDVAWLLLLQATHGITFALGFMGCVHFIANWTDEGIAAETQSLFVVGQQIFSIIAVTGFGALVPLLGAQAYFVASAFALVGAFCIWLSLRMQPPKAG